MAPGYVASRYVYPRATAVVRLFTSLLFGILTVAPLGYFVPYLSSMPSSRPWILGTSLVVGLLFGVLIRVRPRAPGPMISTDIQRQSLIVVVGVLLVASYVTFTTPINGLTAWSIWAPCPHQSAAFMLCDGKSHGLQTWDPAWGTYVNHVIDRTLGPGFGLEGVLSNQRPGSMAVITQPVAFFGSGGFSIATFCYFLLIGSGAAALAAARSPSAIVQVLIALIFLLGVRDIAFYMTNENALGLGLGIGLLWLLLQRDVGAGPMVFVGLCLALAIGVRPVNAAWLPCAFWLLWPRRR